MGQDDLMFEPIFRRICSSDLSFHAENTIKEIDLSYSSISTDVVMFILERFPVLEELNVDMCENVEANDLAQFLYVWIFSQRTRPNSRYGGRKIALQRFIFCESLSEYPDPALIQLFLQTFLTVICVGPVVIE
jgi:hypothetical protein